VDEADAGCIGEATAADPAKVMRGIRACVGRVEGI